MTFFAKVFAIVALSYAALASAQLDDEVSLMQKNMAVKVHPQEDPAELDDEGSEEEVVKMSVDEQAEAAVTQELGLKASKAKAKMWNFASKKAAMAATVAKEKAAQAESKLQVAKVRMQKDAALARKYKRIALRSAKMYQLSKRKTEKVEKEADAAQIIAETKEDNTLNYKDEVAMQELNDSSEKEAEGVIEENRRTEAQKTLDEAKALVEAASHDLQDSLAVDNKKTAGVLASKGSTKQHIKLSEESKEDQDAEEILAKLEEDAKKKVTAKMASEAADAKLEDDVEKKVTAKVEALAKAKVAEQQEELAEAGTDEESQDLGEEETEESEDLSVPGLDSEGRLSGFKDQDEE